MPLFGVTPFEELVTNATSEMLPGATEDMMLNLQVCDLIKGKQVPAKEGVRVLKNRMAHKNPNVQLLTLKLLEMCVMNCGLHFVTEVAKDLASHIAAEFARNNSIINDVRAKSLEIIQILASAFLTAARNSLGMPNPPEFQSVIDLYNTLKMEGYQFPPMPKINAAAILHTEAAPDWAKSSICNRCRVTFTLMNRQHHCRSCGQSYCHSCSSKTMALPHLGIEQEVRVCDSCFARKGAKMGDDIPIGSLIMNQGHHQQQQQQLSQEDALLQKAIQMSLAESQASPKKTPQSTSRPASTHPTSAEEEDADIARAIAESLKSATPRQQSPAKSSTPVPAPSAPRAPVVAKPSAPPAKQVRSYGPAYGIDFTAADEENLALFMSLVPKIEEQARTLGLGTIGSGPNVALCDQVGTTHLRLLKGIDHVNATHEGLMKLNEKLNSAIKTYDRLLEERLSGYYGKPQGPPVHAHHEPPRGPQGFYPPHQRQEEPAAYHNPQQFQQPIPAGPQQGFSRAPEQYSGHFQPAAQPMYGNAPPENGFAAPSNQPPGPPYLAAPAYAPMTGPPAQGVHSGIAPQHAAPVHQQENGYHGAPPQHQDVHQYQQQQQQAGFVPNPNLHQVPPQQHQAPPQQIQHHQPPPQQIQHQQVPPQHQQPQQVGHPNGAPPQQYLNGHMHGPPQGQPQVHHQFYPPQQNIQGHIPQQAPIQQYKPPEIEKPLIEF